jgi:Co/Zn/Cd efflux system component
MPAKSTHILNAASNLLGIAMLIVTGLKLTGHSRTTYADEFALGAAVLLAVSCLLSYLAIRRIAHSPLEDWADRIFIVGLVALVTAVVVLAV